jgi:S-formylglutathione hydrolase FrmB
VLRPFATAAAVLFIAACQTPAGPPSAVPSSTTPSAATLAPSASIAAVVAPAPSATSIPTAAPLAATHPLAAPGHVLTRSFHSASLGVDKTYLVYLPADYDGSQKRFPVVYLLHGYGGDEANWVGAGKLPHAADAIALEAIVVMPDGDDGFYTNWMTPLPYEECLDHRPSSFGHTERAETYCVQKPHYEDYITRDLIAHVDATYRTVAERRARAVAGVSMGGFGAMMLAMRHKDVFATAISHSGFVAPLYGGPHPYKEGAVTLLAAPVLPEKPFPEDFRAQASRVFGADLANWRAHDPTALAASLKDGDLALYVDCGTADDFHFQDHAQYLHEVLGKAGVSHAFELVPGGHSFALWKDRIEKGLAFAAAQFQKGGF